jgi:hypothetical protein
MNKAKAAKDGGEHEEQATRKQAVQAVPNAMGPYCENAALVARSLGGNTAQRGKVRE